VPARLQLSELQRLLAACDALSYLAECAGARPVLTLRNAVQSQCKLFLDSMHAHSMTQMTGARGPAALLLPGPPALPLSWRAM
jgi:hypothetical protein